MRSIRCPQDQRGGTLTSSFRGARRHVQLRQVLRVLVEPLAIGRERRTDGPDLVDPRLDVPDLVVEVLPADTPELVEDLQLADRDLAIVQRTADGVVGVRRDDQPADDERGANGERDTARDELLAIQDLRPPQLEPREPSRVSAGGARFLERRCRVRGFRRVSQTPMGMEGPASPGRCCRYRGTWGTHVQTDRRTRDRVRLFFWAVLTVVCLVAVVVARQQQTQGLQRKTDAAQERAVRFTQNVLADTLDAQRVARPIERSGYDQLLATLKHGLFNDQRVVRARVWDADGLLVFTTDIRPDRVPSRTMRSPPALRGDMSARRERVVRA